MSFRQLKHIIIYNSMYPCRQIEFIPWKFVDRSVLTANDFIRHLYPAIFICEQIVDRKRLRAANEIFITLTATL